ncbi:MAG: hypothetical protein HY791_09790 [Deltaproteobacteria bacterium]|nr:hypothetical protein [Deltaproteobacteria bacterium]
MRWVVIVCLGLGACAETTECASPVDCARPADAGSNQDATVTSFDGGWSDAGEAKVVEVGTGYERFEELTEDQEIRLTLGPQGGGPIEGYHIWSAVRTSGLEPGGLRVLFTILDAETRSVHARTERLVDLQPTADGRFVAYGFAPRLHDCCVVRGTSILMHAEVIDSGGMAAWDEKRVRAAAMCSDGQGGDVCE